MPFEPKSVAILASARRLGARIVPSEDVDRAFGMPPGKLRSRAGIESLAYAVEGQDESSLGADAALEALQRAGESARGLDWIIATSETHHRYPSLAAELHSALGAPAHCGALDTGGACLGLLHAFAAAQSFLVSGRARKVLVVSADVHSRIFQPGRLAGEFGGLFGDGASTFLLASEAGANASVSARLGELFFGCVDQYAGAIRVAPASSGKFDVVFDGPALSRAAITRMDAVLREAARCSGEALQSAIGFATHQPNPRLVSLLAKQLGAPQEKFPAIARGAGNLGSSTCGAALDAVLRSAATDQRHGVVLLASLGPGLLYGGGWVRV